ncbi:MAG: hypothetical protein MJ211_11330 [Bacteroidales bacterium]|nr:hypothetical protein [Bacteroidales bacterium]
MKKSILAISIIALLASCGGNNTQQKTENSETLSQVEKEDSPTPSAKANDWSKPLFAIDLDNDTIIKWIYNDKGLVTQKIYVDKKFDDKYIINYKYEGNKKIYSRENFDVVFEDWDIYHCTWGEYGDEVVDEYSDNTFTKLISVNDAKVNYDEQGRVTNIGDFFTYEYSNDDNLNKIKISYSFMDIIYLDDQGRITYRDNSASYPSDDHTDYKYNDKDKILTLTHTFQGIDRDEEGMIGEGSDPEENILYIHF